MLSVLYIGCPPHIFGLYYHFLHFPHNLKPHTPEGFFFVHHISCLFHLLFIRFKVYFFNRYKSLVIFVIVFFCCHNHRDAVAIHGLRNGVFILPFGYFPIPFSFGCYLLIFHFFVLLIFSQKTYGGMAFFKHLVVLCVSQITLLLSMDNNFLLHLCSLIHDICNNHLS